MIYPVFDLAATLAATGFCLIVHEATGRKWALALSWLGIAASAIKLFWLIFFVAGSAC